MGERESLKDFFYGLRNKREVMRYYLIIGFSF